MGTRVMIFGELAFPPKQGAVWLSGRIAASAFARPACFRGALRDQTVREVFEAGAELNELAGPSFFYVTDDGDLAAVRYDNWKMVFMEQRAQGTLLIWANPFTNLRVPKIFNLRTDPYERADITSNTYYDWLIDHVFLLVPAQEYVGGFLMSF